LEIEVSRSGDGKLSEGDYANIFEIMLGKAVRKVV
jgi:hypothetical protein